MKISGYIISLLLIATGPMMAQEVVVDTTTSRFIPSGIRIGIDLIHVGQAIETNGIKAITQGDMREIHLSADIDFYRYFFNVEYGKYNKVFTTDEGFYENNGSYLKFGPDINFLHRDPDKSALFFGIRYARATLSDRAGFSYVNEFWGNGTRNLSNNSLHPDWFELTTGMKVKIFKTLWLGYTGRFKFGVDTYERNELISHYVPGYGRADQSVTWGFDYWLIFRIPFRRQK